MPSIDTLVDDIYEFIKSQKTDYLEQALNDLTANVKENLERQLFRERTGNQRLYFSNLGTPCDRKLWYKCNENDKAEELQPWVKIKFMYGDILEELLLFLAEAAGHKVEAQQERVTIGDMSGRIDAIIDGVVVDVKSASTFGFRKFKEGTLADDDKFGYIDQLHGYAYALKDDPRVTDKSRVAFFAIDKTTGHICLDIHRFSEKNYSEVVEAKLQMTKQEDVPPRLEDIPEGKSGNRKLSTFCSYCEFKEHCWPDLRTFVYSRGPTFLTHVEKEPKVFEKVQFV